MTLEHFIALPKSTRKVANKNHCSELKTKNRKIERKTPRPYTKRIHLLKCWICFAFARKQKIEITTTIAYELLNETVSSGIIQTRKRLHNFICSPLLSIIQCVDKRSFIHTADRSVSISPSLSPIFFFFLSLSPSCRSFARCLF